MLEVIKRQVCLNSSKGLFSRSEKSDFGPFTHFDIFLPFIHKLLSNLFSIFCIELPRKGTNE